MNAYLLNTETMQWPIYEGELAILHPNTSFPVPLINPPEPYVWVNDVPQPGYEWLTHGIREVTPTYVDGSWYRTWEIYALSPEEVLVNENASRQLNKQSAGELLQSTDWTATVDISDPQYSDPYLGNQDAFLAYRSAVRKIAVNPPVVVESWPVQPDEVWVTT